MTRKDYVLLAKALASMPDFAPSLRTAKASAVAVIADALATDNPRFDRDLFCTMCGVSSNGGQS